MTHRDRSEYKIDSSVMAVCKSVTIPGMTGHVRRNTHMYLDGNESEMNISEHRFLEDDLKRLVELGLLRQDLNGNGQNLYIFTRSASELVKSANL